MPTSPIQRWAIFCRVIDNYGDIGVAWRLARQLAHEQGLAVTLWVDALEPFARIWPEIDSTLGEQLCENVIVRAWHAQTDTTRLDAADMAGFADCGVVIEAFGCMLPERYLVAMAACEPKPVWINLEYLTAEPWAGTHHGLPSPHPGLPLVRQFFFPGYRADTGGLLRERGLPEYAQTWRDTCRADYWHAAGCDPDALHISLFAYDNPALPALLTQWSGSPRAVVCHVPEGPLVSRVADWLGGVNFVSGSTRTHGALTVRVLPFVRQDAYDHLLWACDVNFVRGEDSCVRAQWAGQPFVWQAYPQDDDVHRDKLCALFDLYADGFGQRDALHQLWLAWNGFAPPEQSALAWQNLDLGIWTRHTRQWRETLAAQSDLVSQLVAFARAKAGS